MEPTYFRFKYNSIKLYSDSSLMLEHIMNEEQNIEQNLYT